MIFSLAFTSKGRVLLIGVSKSDYDDMVNGSLIPLRLTELSPGQAPRQILLLAHEDQKDQEGWMEKAGDVLSLYMDEAGHG